MWFLHARYSRVITFADFPIIFMLEHARWLVLMDVGKNRSSLGKQVEVENYSCLAFSAREHSFFWLVMTIPKQKLIREACANLLYPSQIYLWLALCLRQVGRAGEIVIVLALICKSVGFFLYRGIFSCSLLENLSHLQSSGNAD